MSAQEVTVLLACVVGRRKGGRKVKMSVGGRRYKVTFSTEWDTL